MSTYTNLPAPSPEQGLNRYMQEIRKFPLLEPEEEYMLAKRWVDHQDRDAAHRLVTSHLRLAAKMAMGYRGYGLPQAEVISEANVGLMQAVKRFDPEKGFRLATYAMWWIRASIQEYILRSWSLVKLGTTSAQKKLFFNLRKAKNKLGAMEEGDLRPENVAQIARDLNVTETEVISMNRRLSGGDASLNATVGSDGEGTTQWQDWLEDEDADQAEAYAEKDEMDARREMLSCRDGCAERPGKGHPGAAPPAGSAGHAGRPVGAVFRQPRTDPPDRGAGVRKAAGTDAGTGAQEGHAGRRLIATGRAPSPDGAAPCRRDALAGYCASASSGLGSPTKDVAWGVVR